MLVPVSLKEPALPITTPRPEAQASAAPGRSAHQGGTGAPNDEPSTLLRKICLFVSNTILQFPAVFELQQKALSQPTLLRAEVERELAEMAQAGTSFKVLDYGCGSGTYTGLFPPENYLGIDCSEPMLERAEKQHPRHDFVLATNLAGISDRIDDVGEVLLIGVIHHLHEEDLVTILSALPRRRRIKMLAIDTLRCPGGPGWAIQLFERGEYLRDEADHRRLLHRVADETSYKKVPYGSVFELAVFRGWVKPDIV